MPSSQKNDVTDGGSKWSCFGLIFVDPEVMIDGAYYYDLLLS